MAYATEQFNKVKADMRNSWYFRIYLLAWLVCGSATLSSLVVFSDFDGYVDPDENVAVSIVNASELVFPEFQIRYGNIVTGSFLKEVLCSHDGVSLQHLTCGDGSDPQNCIEFETSQIIAENRWDAPVENRQINCIVETESGGSTLVDPLTWEFDERFADSIFGPQEMRKIKLTPNSRIFIHLTKYQSLYNSKLEHESWNPIMAYYGTETAINTYAIYNEIQSFKVMRYNVIPYKNITGWESCAWIGGFALFMYGLHWVFMSFVGLGLHNNSQFLNSDRSASDYTDYGASDKISSSSSSSSSASSSSSTQHVDDYQHGSNAATDL